MSDKTEEPTPKRIRKAQEEGNSPLSTFASQSVAFLAAVAIAPAAVVALVARSSGDLRAAIARAGDASPAIDFDPMAVAGAVIALSLPILVAAAVTGAVTSVVQTGGVIATKKLTPNLGKLNPVEGFKQLLSGQRLVAILRSALFAAAVVWIVHGALRSNAANLARAAGKLDAAVTLAGAMATDVAKRAAVIGLFLAVLDVVVTRRSWRKKLMMSKDEVKREHKESEGDPELKAARERAHHEMLASATVGNVKTASVVIVNPTHIACALRYDSPDHGGSDEAPVLVASGHGDLAKRIVEAAHHYGVPVLRDIPLARALVELEIGDEIPEALYEAVAEILREAWEESPPEPAQP
ncbi:MAG: EscU/YscU/HrcU family type III secretion system export apparatus switch protein [Labilithrix sp.]|nr:EscU/YscU/HrcU family type III secretion system export apparatus switch protein [Labilithrix sp.]MBX3224636.1 EscU/YscU/HrcU family type III secretion system export apparatus switch protein [Labilithrix sp.]